VLRASDRTTLLSILIKISIYQVLPNLKSLQLYATGSHIFRQMTLQELQKQALQLSTGDRWQLVQALLESLKQEVQPQMKRGNLSRLRGIAKTPATTGEANIQEDYVTYLIKKYQ
jgi:hypothetical protein